MKIIGATRVVAGTQLDKGELIEIRSDIAEGKYIVVDASGSQASLITLETTFENEHPWCVVRKSLQGAVVSYGSDWMLRLMPSKTTFQGNGAINEIPGTIRRWNDQACLTLWDKRSAGGGKVAYDLQAQAFANLEDFGGLPFDTWSILLPDDGSQNAQEIYAVNRTT